MKTLPVLGLPEELRTAIKDARQKQRLSQAALGKKVGLPQMHISTIESGKITPRFDTVLDLVRALGFDLILVPRSRIGMVNAMIKAEASTVDTPLYALDYYHDEDT